jgi:hypothetical protein
LSPRNSRESDSSRLARSLKRLGGLTVDRFDPVSAETRTPATVDAAILPASVTTSPAVTDHNVTPPDHAPEASAPVTSRSPVTTGESSRSTASASPGDAEASAVAVIPPLPIPDADFEAWRDRWSDKSDQVAYRLTLIDAQFEELLRARERESPATLPGPATTDRDPIVSPLMSEL